MYTLFVILSFHLNLVHCANILGVSMFPSISHQIVFQKIWRELSLRGHNVTVVTTDPINDLSLTNLTEINVSHHYEFWKQFKIQKILSKNDDSFRSLYTSFKTYDSYFGAKLNITQFQNLKNIDLVLVESIPLVLSALSEKFKAPVIALSSVEALTAEHDTVGNPNHPVLYPDLMLGSFGKEISFWQKIISVIYGMWSVYHHRYVSVPRTQIIAEEFLGTIVVEDIAKKISMRFPSTILYPVRPNVPAMVEAELLHIKPVEDLPEDLQKILDEAVEGVVYVSFGSNIKSVDLDENLRRIITQAMCELPFTIIWKWEDDYLPNKPSNVVTRKWLPQQDLLAHPHIRAFVTQGGFQSLEEAISRAVPVVGLPFIGDQPMNVQRIVDLKIGLGLDPVTVTTEELRNSIIAVSSNYEYKKKVNKVRAVLLDRPMAGLEKAVWWSEYVMRHKGARHLRSPSADISWFHFLMIDVILAAVIITCGSHMVIKYTYYCIFRYIQK